MQVFGANEGTVLMDGVPFSPKKIGIGYLPEERGLYPKKTVTEQLMYLAAEGMRTRGGKGGKTLAGTDGCGRLCVPEAGDSVKGSSNKKVQLAATLLHDPPVIISG